AAPPRNSAPSRLPGPVRTPARPRRCAWLRIWRFRRTVKPMSLDDPPGAGDGGRARRGHPPVPALRRGSAAPLFCILGPLEVTLPDGTPVALPQRLHRAALTALLLHPGDFCSRDWLITTIWPAPPPSGATALWTVIYALRQRLGVLGDRIQTR